MAEPTPSHRRLLSRDVSLLLVIDVQERYIPHLFEGARVVEATRRLIEGAKLVGVPILHTEQYPQGLGPTTQPLRDALPPGQAAFSKLAMSCMAEPGFADALRAKGREQVVVAGIEAHACVNQTAHELLAAGYETHVVIDAISARFERDYRIAIERLVHVGAVPTTVEAVLLEWVRTARVPEFQQVRALIREPLPGA